MNPKRLVLVLALLAELGAKEMPSNAANLGREAGRPGTDALPA